MRFETEIAPGVALWDVSHLLPGKGYPKRDPAKIDRAFVHHSGALGRPGLEGIIASARYVVEQRGWPGFAYTYWIPAETVRDDEGRMVMYRGQPDDRRSYHTGGDANTYGVACALQGNTTRRPLTESHIECMEAWIPWIAERYGLRMPYALGWHSIATTLGAPKNKPSCPGRHAQTWLEAYVTRAA